MIRSMTAFGAGRAEFEHGSVSAEVRSVNNRFLDLNLKLPDDLRFAEAAIRELVGQSIIRGKIELRLVYALSATPQTDSPDTEAIQALAAQLQWARQFIPDLQPPAFGELARMSAQRNPIIAEQWLAPCLQAAQAALKDLDASRQREGARLASAMLEIAADMAAIVARLKLEMPQLLQLYQERIAQKLQEALLQACPEGFSAIGGAELSARIAQEAGIFGLRTDVAEELTRLDAHLQELQGLLGGAESNAARGHGKRLDFLFQEMNREANTLGSKAAALTVTQAAIELKLLIEQLREQAMNLQ